MGRLFSRAVVVAAVGLSVVPVVAAANSNTAVHNGLLHEIQTDKYSYRLPELVDMDYAVTNITGEPIVIGISYCGCELFLSVYDPGMILTWADPGGCFAEECGDTLDPDESYVIESTWDMHYWETGELIEELGIYTVQGKLGTYTPELKFTIELEIEITERPSEAEPLPNSWGVIKALYR